MKIITLIITAVLLLGSASLILAHPGPNRGHRHQAGFYPSQGACAVHHGWAQTRFYRDENRDGICDLRGVNQRPGTPRPAADGDGIPNGRDPDFQRSYIDHHQDGICDHHQELPNSNPPSARLK